MGALEKILDASPDAMLLVAADGTINYASQACQELFGYTPDELVGRPVEVLVPEGRRQEHQAQRQAFALQPRVRNMSELALKTAVLRADGQELPVDIKLSPLAEFTLAVVRDARERLKTEKTLRESNARLQQLDETRNQFLGILAHDLRSPLTVVRGYSDLLLGQRMGQLGPLQSEAVEQIRESVTMMLSLVNDLLDLTAIEKGVLVLRLAPTRIRQLVERAVERHQLLAREKGQVIEFESELADLELLIDPNRIDQVLDNLLSNAIKFSPAKARIQVNLAEQKQEFILSVRDEGPGIPEHFRPQLFQPYTTSGLPTTAKEPSTGLGLAIVQKIVVGHRGRIWFEPGDRTGSVFHVSLPGLGDPGRGCP